MNPVVKLAASALPGEKKYVLFAGAGVSKDAGMPTAWDLMLKTARLLYAADGNPGESELSQADVEKWFVGSEYAKKTYSELIGTLYPTYPEQQSFLKDCFGNPDPGESHKLIAELARRGIIRAIVTTNFDSCIEKALHQAGLEVQVISTDEDLVHSEPLIHCKAVRVYKPHGDLGKGMLRNTPADLMRLSPAMERELVRLLSEHGVVVLGYAGADEGIRRVFRERNRTYYPVFWVDPRQPAEAMAEILRAGAYTYIECTSASEFIHDWLGVLDRLQMLAPGTGSAPTLHDLRRALSSPHEPVGPLFNEFLETIFKELQRTRPDFDKFEHRDDAIVAQIEAATPITYSFIEAALLAGKYGSNEAADALYRFFGKVYPLYDIPRGFSGSFYETDFDGFKFLGFEMVVGLVAALMKHDRWDIIGRLLSQDVFADTRNGNRYVHISELSSYVESLNHFRNNRLKLNRLSVMADVIKERFTKSRLSSLIDHIRFMEADYFLFMRTVCRAQPSQVTGFLIDVWCPRSCVFLHSPPSYIVKAESKRFLSELAAAAGFENDSEFVERLQERHRVFVRYFRNAMIDSPLDFYDLTKLGSRQ